LQRLSAGRWDAAEDLKGMTLFLAWAASDDVHGTVLTVDGWGDNFFFTDE